jgi:pimeloyl-ACP methyl ester carboxylesterase
VEYATNTAVGAEKAVLAGNIGGWVERRDLGDRTSRSDYPSRSLRRVLPGSTGAARLRSRGRQGVDDAHPQRLGRNTPAFRQLFTSRYFRSDADPALIAHFNELQRLSTDPDTAAPYYESVHSRGDGSDLYRQLRIPVLIVHSREDLAVSADEGRLLASVIPDSQLVLLPSGMHYFPADAEVVTKAARAITRFLG